MTKSGSRGRPRDSATDVAILRSVVILCIERGVEGTSIAQMAKQAGVGKPSIYRRWSTKEDLIAAAMEKLVV
jgi:AcrR family transcriptional regulator